MACKDYLAALNSEQRRAVEHGVTAVGPNLAGPLLIIAGARSGRTNTLAHRVAHLIVNGVPNAGLIDRISGAEFLEAFSIYSRGHLRKLGDHLGEITNVQLKENPLQVDDVLKLFDRLATTIKQTAASEKRIEARSSFRQQPTLVADVCGSPVSDRSPA